MKTIIKSHSKSFECAVIYQLILLMIISSCTSGGGSTKPANDWDKQHLKGKVKSITETSFKVEEKFGEYVKGQRDGIHDQYDELNLQFNTDGNLTQELRIYLSGPASKRVYLFDNQRRCIEERFSYIKRNEESYRDQFSVKNYYDDYGNVIFKENYSPDGKITEIDTLYYNKDGNLIEIKAFDTDGNMGGKVLYKYTKDGNESEDAVYHPDGSILSKQSTDYDGPLKIKVSYQQYDHYQIMVYDQSQQIVERSTYKIINTDKIINEDNLKLSSRWRFQYEYDEHGNWINQYQYQEDKKNPTFVVEREIEYY